MLISIIYKNCNNNIIIVIISIFIITLILYFGILIFLYYIILTLWSHYSYFLCINSTIKPHASR
jgi:fatty-acid desaturase